MQKRLDIRVDFEIESLIKAHIRDGEKPLQCYKRLADLGGNSQKIIDQMRLDQQRTIEKIVDLLKISHAEQSSSNERFIAAVHTSMEPSRLENLSNQIERRIEDFTNSVQKPFQDISENLSEIRDRVVN